MTQAVDGLSGKNRRKVHMLKVALEAAEVECDRLHQEMQELVQYTDAELSHLKQEIERITKERDELQLQVLILEEEQDIQAQTHTEEANESPTTISISGVQREETTPALPVPSSTQPSQTHAPHTATPTSTTTEGSVLSTHLPPDSPLIDLSDLRIALVGGHPTTRRGVIQELQSHYGLKHFVEIPRMSEVNTSRNRVKSKIYRCNLVVLITGYMSHRLTEIVFSLKDAGALAGDVVQLNCKGKSGVLRGILEHVESRAT
ncbi:MAG: hypothetical protein F6K09_23310 [Merismopedia sp. SIO2A8]|nr:hypothetical protein [Merismopedia sp. SIO2A8]